jgi:RNA exonuclease 1
VYTTDGIEVARVTLLDACGDVLLDELIKPQYPVLDYSTSFSGLTEEGLSKAILTLESFYSLLHKYIYKETILIGHSLDNDLKALRVSKIRRI